MVIDKETRGSTVAFLAQINSAYLLKRVNTIFIVLTILLTFLLSLFEWKYTLLTKLKKLIITKKEYLQLYLRIFKKEISRNEY